MQEKLNIIYSTVREPISYRRNREQQIFAWSSAILVAIISALLFSDSNNSLMASSHPGKMILTFLISLIFIGSWLWQSKQRELLCKSQALAVKIMCEMKLFDLKYSPDQTLLLPKEWESWGSEKLSLREKYFQSNKMQCTVLLGIVAIFVTWRK